MIWSLPSRESMTMGYTRTLGSLGTSEVEEGNPTRERTVFLRCIGDGGIRFLIGLLRLFCRIHYRRTRTGVTRVGRDSRLQLWRLEPLLRLVGGPTEVRTVSGSLYRDRDSSVVDPNPPGSRTKPSRAQGPETDEETEKLLEPVQGKKETRSQRKRKLPPLSCHVGVKARTMEWIYNTPKYKRQVAQDTREDSWNTPQPYPHDPLCLDYVIQKDVVEC